MVKQPVQTVKPAEKTSASARKLNPVEQTALAKLEISSSVPDKQIVSLVHALNDPCLQVSSEDLALENVTCDIVQRRLAAAFSRVAADTQQLLTLRSNRQDLKKIMSEVRIAHSDEPVKKTIEQFEYNAMLDVMQELNKTDKHGDSRHALLPATLQAHMLSLILRYPTLVGALEPAPDSELRNDLRLLLERNILRE